MIHGIFWDCDGTIMDTETSYGLAWKEHLKSFGLDISEKETRQWVGVDDRLVHSFYAKIVDPFPVDLYKSNHLKYQIHLET